MRITVVEDIGCLSPINGNSLRRQALGLALAAALCIYEFFEEFSGTYILENVCLGRFCAASCMNNDFLHPIPEFSL